MSANTDRPTLRSYLSESGIPPEKFLEALEILKQEIRVVLEGREAPPSLAPPRMDEGAENEEIRRILEEIKERWASEDRATTQAAGEVPPAAFPDAGRITMETVILRPSSSRRASAEERPSPSVRSGDPESPQPAPPKEEGGDALLQTIVKTSGERPQRTGGASRKESSPAPPDDAQETVILRGGPPPPAAPSKPPSLPEEEDDLSRTVILRPGSVKGKGKGGGA